MSLKLASWKPHAPPSKKESLDHIRLISNFVKAKYKKARAPIGLLQIYLEYKNVILDENGEVQKSWPWGIHGKRWLDRRVNEAADPKFLGSTPEIVAATSEGMFQTLSCMVVFIFTQQRRKTMTIYTCKRCGGFYNRETKKWCPDCGEKTP